MAAKKRRKTKKRGKLYHVIAQGHKITRLGHTSFTKAQALQMAKYLKNRVYGTPELIEDRFS